MTGILSERNASNASLLPKTFNQHNKVDFIYSLQNLDRGGSPLTPLVQSASVQS